LKSQTRRGVIFCIIPVFDVFIVAKLHKKFAWAAVLIFPVSKAFDNN
jgi:hypothetical protein